MKQKNIAIEHKHFVVLLLRSFFLSLIALAYAFFVLFATSLPSEPDLLYQDDKPVQHNFFSYVYDHHHHNFGWLLAVMLAFSIFITSLAKSRKISMNEAYGAVLFIGSILAIMNFPALLIWGWYPYSLLLQLIFILALAWGIKLSRLRKVQRGPFQVVLGFLVVIFIAVFVLYIYSEFPIKE